MILCAITSRSLLGNSEAERADKLLALATTWAASGVDYIQIREKDLSPTDLTKLAAKIVQATRQTGSLTKVLINASPETATTTALNSKADGIHIPGGLNPQELAAAVAQTRKSWQTRRTWQAREPSAEPSAEREPPVISVSCHSTAEVRAARAAGATLALFAPVFEKILPGNHPALGENPQPLNSPRPVNSLQPVASLPGQGLKSLAEACQTARKPSPHPKLPILALGGITLENAPQCLNAGAAGIAAIRLFLSAPYAQNRGAM